MEDLLIEKLSSLDYEVRLQGSLLPNEPYPDSFFTFWNNSSESESYYDNKENAIVYNYDVNFYSNNPEKVYSVVRDAINLLKDYGFIISGDGYSVPSDEKTHDGRGFEATFIKYL